MKTLLGVLVIASLMLSIAPMVLATSIGAGISPDITTEDFAPMVWACDDRVVLDDNLQGGRFSAGGDEMFERVNNYAFEGEQIVWTVLVMDKNGINKVEDVFGTIGTTQGAGNDIEVNCVESTPPQFDGSVDSSCNARILEEDLTGESIDNPTGGQNIFQYYDCTFTVETSESMYGEYWITVEAIDLDGLSGTMAENEFWFLNPVIALSIDGDLTFTDVRPGAVSYSSTLLVGNDADDSSGVLLDMFISGTDFYDSSSSGAMCPTTNQLVLGDADSDCDYDASNGFTDGSDDPFCYFASHGAYSTRNDGRADAEGYVGINYGTSFNTPVFIGGPDWYGAANGDATGYEIIQDPAIAVTTPYFPGNVVSPGAEMALTFRLFLPEPCNGDFDTGDIFFWGEAI